MEEKQERTQVSKFEILHTDREVFAWFWREGAMRARVAVCRARLRALRAEGSRRVRVE